MVSLCSSVLCSLLGTTNYGGCRQSGMCTEAGNKVDDVGNNEGNKDNEEDNEEDEASGEQVLLGKVEGV